jgi:charged multivesicular body protein 2B
LFFVFFFFQVNDTLDGVLDGSDDEAESDNIVNQVLDEIGVEISGKLINAPTPGKAGPSRASAAQAADSEVSDAEIEKMLARLTSA